jgi:hypothetical protein
MGAIWMGMVPTHRSMPRALSLHESSYWMLLPSFLKSRFYSCPDFLSVCFKKGKKKCISSLLGSVLDKEGYDSAFFYSEISLVEFSTLADDLCWKLDIQHMLLAILPFVFSVIKVFECILSYQDCFLKVGILHNGFPINLKS